MNKKLVFYPEKMTWVCVLLGISAFGSILTLLYPLLKNDYDLTFNDYLRTLVSFVFALAPVTASLILLNRYKSKQLGGDTLLKLFFYVEAALSISSMIFTVVFYFVYDSHLLDYDVLGQERLRYSSLMDYIKQNLMSFLCLIISSVIYILLAKNTKDAKSFNILRLFLTGMCLYNILGNIIYVISLIKTMPTFKELASTLTISAISCVMSLINQAAILLLIFGAYKIEAPEIEVPIEEKFKSLDEKYAAGQIGKEAYEAARAELLKQL